MMGAPFSVHVEGDPEGSVVLVLAVAYPFLLVGPEAGADRLRWVAVDDVTFGRLYLDQPWQLPFLEKFNAPASPADHAH